MTSFRDKLLDTKGAVVFYFRHLRFAASKTLRQMKSTRGWMTFLLALFVYLPISVPWLREVHSWETGKWVSLFFEKQVHVTIFAVGVILTAGLLMFNFMRSIWVEQRDSRLTSDEERLLVARRTLRARLEEAHSLAKGAGPSAQQNGLFADGLRADIEELLINPSWEEFQRQVYNKSPYTKSNQSVLTVTASALGELISKLHAGDLRDPESDPNLKL